MSNDSEQYSEDFMTSLIIGVASRCTSSKAVLVKVVLWGPSKSTMIPYALKKSVNASDVTQLYEISDLAHNSTKRRDNKLCLSAGAAFLLPSLPKYSVSLFWFTFFSSIWWIEDKWARRLDVPVVALYFLTVAKLKSNKTNG